jgi:anti-sigma B factor antagonist
MIDTPEGTPAVPAEALASDAQYRCDVSFLGEHAVIAVMGELDLASAPELLREVQGTLALPLNAVAVDLSEVSFMDSSGIHTLLVAKSSAEERGIDFCIVSPSRQGRYVIDVAGLTAHFGLDPA